MAIYTIQADGYDWDISTLGTNRLATIKFSDADTSKSAISSIKSLYLAVMDRMDEATEMSDSNPMTADTPTEYNVGKLGAGAADAWFIDKESTEHLTGGALKTVGWKRVEGTNTGVIKVICNNTNIVVGDIGEDITYGTDNDSGVLLDVKGTGADSELWIRPDDDTSANSFDNTPTVGGTLTCNTHTATQSSASTTGEMQWSNIYNTGIATLASGSHQYIYQGDKTADSAFDARVERYKTASEDWWEDGTFDVLLLVAEQATDLVTRSAFIDEGYALILARQYGTTYSYYIVDLFAGGRNPIPLETGSDLNNTTGYYTATTGTHGVSTFVVGEEIDTGAIERGILTAFVDNTSISWYQIGDPQDLFENSDTVTGETSGTTATLSQAPQAAGPSILAGMSITFGNTNSHDVDADDTNEYYSVDIDCSDELLTDMYEWTKYITRNNGTTTGNTDGIEGEQYIGIDYRMTYASNTGPILEGDSLIQDNTGATGTVVALHTGSTPDWVTIRNTRGTWSHLTADLMKKDGTPGNYLTPNNDSAQVVAVTPVKPNPFGIFAGGFWFLAQGVVLTNRNSNDANSYSTIDDTTGVIYEEPTSISVAITNTRQQDKMAIYRLDGAAGVIEKGYYGSTAISANANAIIVDTNIRVDEPGKSTGGWVIVGDVSTGEEHVYRYSSWTGTTFTLNQNATGAGDGSSSTTELYDAVPGTGTLNNLVVGELVHDTTNSEYAWVTAQSGANHVTTTAKTTTWLAANYVSNDVVINYTTSDYVYVPLLYAYETTGTDGAPGSEQASLVYNTSIPALVRARSATESTYKIKPFGQEISITGNSSTAVVRTTETITS